RHGSPLVVLGMKLKREIFGDDNALGERVRIGGRPFRVIGVMEPKGQFLNLDLDDTAFVPVSEAMRLFNRDDLIEIDVVLRGAAGRPPSGPPGRAPSASSRASGSPGPAGLPCPACRSTRRCRTSSRLWLFRSPSAS